MKMVLEGRLFRTRSTASTAPFGTKFDSLAGAHVALRGGVATRPAVMYTYLYV